MASSAAQHMNHTRTAIASLHLPNKLRLLHMDHNLEMMKIWTVSRFFQGIIYAFEIVI